MRMKHILTTTAVLVCTALALAQEEGGPPQGMPPGPPPQGMQFGGGRPPMGPGMDAHMLLNPDVKKELKLSDSQIRKLCDIMPAPSQGQMGPAQGSASDSQVRDILSGEQYARYKQIQLQAAGPRAFLQPKVAEKLGLSEEQKEKIGEILRANRPRMGQGGQRTDMKAHREMVTNKILQVLSSDQRKTWDGMVGAKFEFRGPQRGMGGRGMGRQERGGYGGGEMPPPPPGGDGGGMMPPPPPDGGGGGDEPPPA